MENAVYNKALAALKMQFGMPRPLQNQNGARFLRNGTITIYHTELRRAIRLKSPSTYSPSHRPTA